ncbi:ESX secretion-associated protein EspG [Nocardia sp. NBC_00565]|uniref:ESX secretion-associated protein EspG n=1 Tax=Nocardia sp. NBC_00565 TaxID=2975993 RepID=UPI002E817A3F|nr:ESX secretion-associated protein EspG [Nocardia sp. NBC_00565]WUC00656.1 ESX secretion-associated protein EspG [Nocardia sp. NBC_00565]
MNWTLTPDQFAMAWARTDGDRIPYPLAVRLSARDTAERAAQLPALNSWCDQTLDADLEGALRVLARPTVRIEVFGQRDAAGPGPAQDGVGEQIGVVEQSGIVTTTAPDLAADSRPVRVLGAIAGDIAVVAAQRAGATADRGGDIRLFVDRAKNLSARAISMLPENTPGTMPQLTAPLARVNEDSRDLVTVPVAGPATPTRIRRLLRQPRDGIGQIVVSVRRADGELHPFGVLCWIDVVGDGRYSVRTGVDVDIMPVNAQRFTAQLRPMVTAAERTLALAERW